MAEDSGGTMLLWLTDAADVRCTHKLGRSPQQASQTWVRIDGRPVLVQPDPVGRPIGGCPNIGVSIKPCTSALAMTKGWSSFVRIDQRAVLRADLTGYTDGTPPGQVRYEVLDAAQPLVGEQP
jgi:hypothetical protein